MNRVIRPPSGYEDHLSRREAAALLGYASEFKVRQLEKEGRLRPVRGAMGAAFYPRVQVEAVGRSLAPAAALVPGGGASSRARAPGRWSDAALIAHLRAESEAEGRSPARARTVVDLVVDAGVPISRAERVYRFWLANDAHPAARRARREREAAGEGPAPRGAAEAPAERRSPERVEHDSLLEQIRDPDPAVRADAFAKLKKKRPP